jgi:acetoin utilization deacetylase AcuC-like enzyme
MKVIFSEQQLKHDPQGFLSSGAQADNPEKPQRAERLLHAAIGCDLQHEHPTDLDDAVIAAVHTPRYLEFLQNIHPRWSRVPGATTEIVPNIHPLSRSDGYPKSAVGQLGFHVYDGSCPITADTWHSARWSAMTAAHAANCVLSGDAACYALSRPPGHHASQDVAGGFCYLNNSAIAAQLLRTKFAKVAIVDIDVHHGNGTQRIFYERDDVLSVSLHADPERFYPFFWGYANETGSGPGKGFNINMPLPRGTGDDQYLASLHDALARVREFSADALVIALGLDAHEDDPFHGMAITTAGFGAIGGQLAALGLPTVMVQEGGYLSDALGENLASFLAGFRNT